MARQVWGLPYFEFTGGAASLGQCRLTWPPRTSCHEHGKHS